MHTKIGARVSKVGQIFVGALHAVADALSVLTGALLLVMGLVITYAVILRYLFGRGVAWATDISEYILFVSVFLGATWVLKHDAHVRVDLIINAVNPTIRNWMAIFTNLLGALVCGFFVYHGAMATYDSYLKGIAVLKIVAVPRYVVLLFIPLGFFLLALEFLVKACETATQLRRQ